MLTEIYIQAVLVDKDLADEVWEVWDEGEIDDFTAYLHGGLSASITPISPCRLGDNDRSGPGLAHNPQTGIC